MSFEIFGAGCFGTVIGYVAWHVFDSAAAALDVKQLAAFIAALLGAVVLAVFPAGTTLFAAYATGLAAGFFFSPLLRSLRSLAPAIAEGLNPRGNLGYNPDHSDVLSQLKYLDDSWAEPERVITVLLAHNRGRVRQRDLAALPLDESGRVAALKKYARVFPERVQLAMGLLGWYVQEVPQRHSGSNAPAESAKESDGT